MAVVFSPQLVQYIPYYYLPFLLPTIILRRERIPQFYFKCLPFIILTCDGVYSSAILLLLKHFSKVSTFANIFEGKKRNIAGNNGSLLRCSGFLA